MSCPRLFEPVDAQHLASCAECRAAAAALDAPRSTGDDLSPLKSAALAELARAPAVRPWWVVALGVVAAAGAAAAFGLWWLPSSTVQHSSVALRQLSTAAWAAALLAGCFAAVMPRARGLRWAVVAVALLGALLTLAAASGVAPEAGDGGCALIEWALSLVPAAVLLVALSGFAFDSSRALAGGVGAASAGLLAVQLHCPDGTLLHQALVHLAAVAVVTGVALALRRALPDRSHAP